MNPEKYIFEEPRPIEEEPILVEELVEIIRDRLPCPMPNDKSSKIILETAILESTEVNLSTFYQKDEATGYIPLLYEVLIDEEIAGEEGEILLQRSRRFSINYEENVTYYRLLLENHYDQYGEPVKEYESEFDDDADEYTYRGEPIRTDQMIELVNILKQVPPFYDTDKLFK